MRRVLLIVATIACASVVTAGDRGFFGFALDTDFEGTFWSPVLAAASIEKVVPGSATARSGVAVGDVLLELEGMSVPGAAGDQLKKLKAALKKQATVGDKLHMKLRKPSGEVYSAVLVAQPRKE